MFSTELKTLFTPFPTLTTLRLRLRQLRADDLQDLYAYASDSEIDQYTPWTRYQSLAEAQADLTEYVGEYERDGFGVWGIEHQADSRLIGITNLSMPHRHHRRSELGYTIARTYWGQGYATEAVQAVVSFGFEQMQLNRIEALVLPNNVASARVLEKVGMRYEGLLRQYQVWQGQPCDLKMYAITRVAL